MIHQNLSICSALR
jgi:hypothetical protein